MAVPQKELLIFNNVTTSSAADWSVVLRKYLIHHLLFFMTGQPLNPSKKVPPQKSKGFKIAVLKGAPMMFHKALME